MEALLSASGRTFLRVFAASLVVYSTGLLDAPSLSRLVLVGVAALLGSLAAAVASLQQYIPQLTFTEWVGVTYGKYLDAFTHGFLAALLVAVVGILGAPDLHTARALGAAAVVGAVNAGVRAVQALFTAAEQPLPGFGVPNPPPRG